MWYDTNVHTGRQENQLVGDYPTVLQSRLSILSVRTNCRRPSSDIEFSVHMLSGQPLDLFVTLLLDPDVVIEGGVLRPPYCSVVVTSFVNTR
ncbi:uncharacterized protein YALI1_D26749g [Yarrowia lipolytica]|uniref:Uncharacterized protein n=1 Tax=Yarrowia lipolytica TaxID=4952 RepID=A0A1D8NFI7_YARLL|nr:hypothetical protein YALI1_D26749g [Yarrowia lipolytica]